MKLADQMAIADEHLDCAIRAVRARTSGNAQPDPVLIAAYMRSMALIELGEEMRALACVAERLSRAVEQIGGDIGSAAELIANAVVE